MEAGILSGTGGNHIYGNALANSLFGNTGNNSIDGGVGQDTMVGGTGNDSYFVDDTLDAVVELAVVGSTDWVIANANGYTLAAEVEHMSLGGGIVSGLGNGGANSLLGNDSNNSLFGFGGNDTFRGGLGNDWLDGGDGNDSILGEGGNDTIDGGAGNDAMNGGDGDDVYYVADLLDTISEAVPPAGGTDMVFVSVNNFNMTTGAANVENASLTGSIANLTGNTIANSISGNTAANSINGGVGADTLLGFAGNDTLLGGTEADSLLGGGDDDSLLGEAGNDTLLGEAGNDTLNGGAGTDSLIGGSGNDYYIIDASDTVVEVASEGTDSVLADFNSAVLAANVEWLIFGANAGIVSGTGNSGDNTISGNTAANSIFGGNGNDSLFGGSGIIGDTLLGEGGNDTLDGGEGNDTMIGGQGNDYYFVDSATDRVVESVGQGSDSVLVGFDNYTLTAGSEIEWFILAPSTVTRGTGNLLDNTLVGNALANTLNGGGGADSLFGGDGADSLFGGNENDTLNGGTGNDTLAGGSGNDVYFVDSTYDIVVEALSAGTDSVFASVSGYVLANHVEYLELSGTFVQGTGNGGDNTLRGNAAGNSLDGNGGNDTLFGMGGNDTLIGGAGNDSLIGGADHDYFLVDSTSDAVYEAASEGTDSVFTTVSGYALSDDVEWLILDAGLASGHGGSTANTLVGNTSANSLFGMGGNDSLWGSGGNDTLDGGTGNDSMAGGANNDYYFVDSLSDNLQESAGQGIDSVYSNINGYTLGDNLEHLELATGIVSGNGNSGNNTILGNDTGNSLSGGLGNDTLLALGGNNTLDGGGGDDSLLGGAGNDLYLVDSTSDIVVEALSAGTDSVFASVSGYVLANHVEYLELSGTFVQGTGNGGDNTLRGNAAGNSLDGNGGNDTLFGMGGNDTLIGGAGNDSLIGGTDHDYYLVDSTSDAVYEAASEGTDSVFTTVSGYVLSDDVEWLILDAGLASGLGGSTANTLIGNTSSNSLFGMGGNDSLWGSSGNDTLDGGTGNDTMVGGTDDDYYFLDSLSDNLQEAAGQGTDSVYSTINGYTLGDNLEHLELATGIVSGTGNNGNNTILGNAIGNSLSGGLGNDTLLALGGNNTLDGGGGDDSLVGGAGGDLYFVDSLGDAVIETLNAGTDSVLASISGYTLAAHVEYLGLLGGVVAGTGNSMRNTLVGNSVGNSLDGGTGIDTLIGGDGNDTYFVDNLSDLVIELANEGSEDRLVSAVSGLTLTDHVEVLELAGTATSGTGNSLDNLLLANPTLGSSLFGGGGEDTFVGGAWNDWFVVDSAGDSLDGGAGTDSVLANVDGFSLGGGVEWLVYGTATIAYGNNSNNTLIGNSLANTLDGGADADSMAGGDGNDYYFVDHLNDIVLEFATGGTSDTIHVDVSGYSIPNHIENITIGGSVISVTGNSSNNILTGNSLNNTLDGGLGADTLVGGDGNDFYIVDNLGDVAVEGSGGGSGIDSVRSNIGYFALGENIEYLLLDIGAVTGAGNSLNNTIIGNNGFYNSLFGGAGNDWLEGVAGSNTLNGGAGDDTMIGGAQSNWFVRDSAGDSIDGGAGDGIISEINGYTLEADFTNLVLGNGATTGTGNSVNNSLTGNSLNNTLNGGGGADTLMGGIGNDYYLINSDDDVVIEASGRGTDTIEFSGFASYTLVNNVERLVLGAVAVHGTGNSLNNTLTGNASNNSLFGGAGNDSIFGGAGNDTLTGANGSVRNEIDTLTGGSGADWFVLGNSSGTYYNDALSSQFGTTDYALITDFNTTEDRLVLKSGSYYFTPDSGGGYQDLYMVTSEFRNEMIARLQGVPSLSAGTFFSSSSPLANLNTTFV